MSLKVRLYKYRMSSWEAVLEEDGVPIDLIASEMWEDNTKKSIKVMRQKSVIMAAAKAQKSLGVSDK